MDELLDLYNQCRRAKKEPAQIESLIEAEGGEVLEHRQVSRLIPSPFGSLRVLPMLYEFRVQYGYRRGHWYVRTSGDNGPYDWAWVDGDGNETLPVAKEHACVAGDVRAVGWLADWVIVIGSIAFGLLACIGIYLLLF